MLMFFFKGLTIGFAIAAPVGPIGILCIQRSLHDGFKIGLATGMGAALADGFYGLVAGLGLTAISSLLIAQQFWIRLVGGLFLFYLGIKLFFKLPQERSADKVNCSAGYAFITTFLLTVANPATILSFIAVFAGLGLGTIDTNYKQSVALILGITFGSAIWWFTLSSVIAFILHHRISLAAMQWINRVSGIVIFAFGVFALFII